MHPAPSWALESQHSSHKNTETWLFTKLIFAQSSATMVSSLSSEQIWFNSLLPSLTREQPALMCSWCHSKQLTNCWAFGTNFKKHSMWLNEKHAWGASLSDKRGRSPGGRALTTFLFWGTHFKLAPWCRALLCFRGSQTLMLCEPHPLGKGRENCILRSCCHEDKYITIICCFLQLRKDLTFIFLWFWKKWCFCRPAKTHKLYCNSSGWAECSETPRSTGRIP